VRPLNKSSKLNTAMEQPMMQVMQTGLKGEETAVSPAWASDVPQLWNGITTVTISSKMIVAVAIPVRLQ
jgi:hypothetical protein